jgi:hypothetical protein
MLHKLGKDGLSGIHSSLSAIAAACRHWPSALNCAAHNSNRKIESYKYLSYYVRVIAVYGNLAGR